MAGIAPLLHVPLRGVEKSGYNNCVPAAPARSRPRPPSAELSDSTARGPRKNPNYLDFEQPIADLEGKIQELRHASHGSSVDADTEIHALKNKLRLRTAQIFRDLSPWQVSQLARHPVRPYTMDYLRVICDEFHELAGDRAYANDQAIVGGLARRS